MDECPIFDYGIGMLTLTPVQTGHSHIGENHMGHAFGLLFASALLPTLLIYFIGSLFLKKIKLTGVTIAVGFFAAWLITAVVALIIADQPTAGAAMQSVVPAAIVGSIISLVGIAVAGKREATSQSKNI